MVNYGISIVVNDPQPDIILRDVRDFAIYNSVVGAIIVVCSYIATVLMNISAYNQVNMMYKSIIFDFHSIQNKYKINLKCNFSYNHT